MSKIQTWKRITTFSSMWLFIDRLYLICQRYKLESESQLTRCSRSSLIAVFNMSKIQTWKRITTPAIGSLFSLSLYLICQRYKLESESQLVDTRWHCLAAVFNMSKIQTWKRITTPWLIIIRSLLLYLICQRYKLESESQHVRVYPYHYIAVFNMSKIQTWKRITTLCL